MSAWSKADLSACLSSDKKRASESIGRPQATRYGQSVLDELDFLDILARGLAIQRELAADNLNDVGVAALSELLGGLAGRKAGAVQHGALNELVLLQVGNRLLDGALVDIGLTDDDGGVEVMGHAAKLLDLGSCQCHGFSLSMYGAPRNGALIYVSCPTIAQERRGVERVCPVRKECGCRVGRRCKL